MQILSEAEAASYLRVPDIGSFFGQVAWRYPGVIPNYRLPKDSGKKVALARLLGNLFLDHGPFFLWVTGTGIWSSAEHLDLFDRYRLSFGEHRTVHDAPVHMLEDGDRAAAISLLCLTLFFIWDVEIIASDRSVAISVSHDEWMEVRHAEGQNALAEHFAKFLSDYESS
ncbi:hypothetical protein [uncultured Paludibaculum sp.]|uniref:hypothetical protein n=1 Tax=uncultured Paludibaculum sp. TaxID=1765020 RepID=UPI002AABAFDE|nr:hypothetical protein [uncultured Paludibaculum sp.]